MPRYAGTLAGHRRTRLCDSRSNFSVKHSDEERVYREYTTDERRSRSGCFTEKGRVRCVKEFSDGLLASQRDVWHPKPVVRLIAIAAGAMVMATSAVASAAAPTVLILPFAQPPDAHRDVGFGVELKIMGALHAMGSLNVVHPKIRDSVMRRHTEAAGMSAEQRRQAYARYVGATWTLEGTMTETPRPMIGLRLAPLTGGPPLARNVSAPTMAAAIAQLPDALLQLVNAIDDGQRAYAASPQPRTDRPDVLARLATCYRLLNQQSVGIRKPALLNDVRVYQAGNRCRAALRKVPNLAEAEAGLAMVDALEGRADEAKARLAKLKKEPGFFAYYWIAKFWVLAKFFSPQQAVEALKTAVDRHPGFMLAQSYLGEALSVMGEHEAALAAYRRYLSHIPNQPFVMARIGHELARLGRHKEAIAMTQKALEHDPNNAEIRLQLGSRFIDHAKFKAAIDVLSNVINDIEARGEVYLRLGYAHLRVDQFAEAERAFRQAIEAATATEEWRTRSRAYYDLAKLHARQSRIDDAFEDLSKAVDEGFQSFEKIENDHDLAPLRKDERFAALAARNPRPPEIPVRFQSPFLVDPDELAKAAAQGALRPAAATDF